MHDGHGHGHSHHHTHSSTRVLLIAMILAFVFAGIEAVGGWWANSLALLSDAGHMGADGLALGLAAFAAWVATKPPTDQHTYGYGRAEVIGAWISSISILAIGIVIIVEAIQRMKSPESVNAPIVIWLGATGIVLNTLIAWVLSLGEKNLNVRAAILHVISDLLGSIAALITGVVIYYTDWWLIDPILSIFITILILISSMALIRESLIVLMEGVPLHIEIADVGKRLTQAEHVKGVHDLHIWTLSSGRIALTAHVELDQMHQWDSILANLKRILMDEFHIHHITLQPEVDYEVLHRILPK